MTARTQLMTSPQTRYADTGGSAHRFRKRWFGCALALSVVLHLAAALAIILAGSLNVAQNSESTFSIQDIDLSPPIGAPRTRAAATAAQPPEMTSIPAAVVPEASEPEPEPEPEREPAPESPPERSDSQENGSESVSASLSLGMAHGFFSGLADGRTLREDIREYYVEVVEKINRQWWEQARLLREPLRQDGIFELLVQRDGTLVSVRLARGTGSAEADLLLTEIIRNACPLPPLPAGYPLSHFQAPLRIKAPLFLFRMKNYS